jgi:transposase-like protein
VLLPFYAVGVSTRKIIHFLESIYGAYYSLQSVSRFILDIWVCREKCQELREPLRKLNRGGVKRVQVFITDDIPGIENSIKMVYPGSEWQFWV